MKLILIGFLALLALSQGGEVVRSYKGSKVYSLNLETDHQAKILWDAKDKLGLDFWTHPRKDGETDVLVSLEEQAAFKQLLRYLQIHYTKVKVDDVQKLIDEEKVANEKARKMRLSAGTTAIDWESFARYAEIEEFINSLPNNSSSAVNITVMSYGDSYEGRTLYAVKYSTSQSNTKSIIVDANIHAREWITSASATWIMNELAMKPDQYAAVLDGIDFYFLPMLNPDGYEFCHTTDRMWRKTRSVNEGSTCRGCDPNRNFPFHFKGASTSDDPCSDIFTGPSPLSEPETSSFAEYIQELKANVNPRAYISFHSAGQLWLTPWAYEARTYPPDYAEQESLGNEVAAAIFNAGFNTTYRVGTAADILYAVGGCTYDWAKSIDIKYSATPEMRGPFILPPEQIIPNAMELMAAVRAVAIRVRSE